MKGKQAFPALTEEEFAQGCKALEQRSADRITGTDWLGVRWTGEELAIRQKRETTPRKEGGKHGNGRGPEIESEVQGEREEEEEGLVEDIVDDSEVFNASASKDAEPGGLLVDFSIVLSPTYSVPVLWFTARHTSENKPLTLDQVYSTLVPSASIESLRRVGVMGGISFAHHPISDMPSFFLHPCNTQAALLTLKPPDESLTPERYLMLWLGLIGSAVGLYVPSKLLST